MGRATFITEAAWAQLLENGRRHAIGEELDPVPPVRLFIPDTLCSWLLTEVDPEDEDRGFGLCDLGLGMPELGYVSLAELGKVCSREGRTIEADASFVGDQRLSTYARWASLIGRIVA